MARNLKQFEKEYGGTRVAELTKALGSVAEKNANETIVDMPNKDNTFRFGVIGDTHFGSLFESVPVVESLYERWSEDGVKVVLHAGDVIDGHGIYKGQEFEQHRVGLKNQVAWFAENSPSIPGMTTKYILGNHDLSFKKLVGVDVGESISSARKDWELQGEDYADITFRVSCGRTYVVRLLHPGGTGSSYALSYRPQKIVEALEGGRKPGMIIVGHYHKAEFLPSYRNIAVLQAGTCQWQTPFMATKGLAAHVGGWTVEVSLGEESTAVKAQFHAFFRPRD